MRVYHFTSAQHGLEDVRLRRLKIATLADLNDPFELAVYSADQPRRRALRATREHWATQFGMLCFSADWHNPVQWSHYADKHRGVCLGFDVPHEMLTQVRYTKTPPRLDWHAIEEGHSALGEGQMLRWLTTKYVHWVYENEWRAFPVLEQPDTNGLYFKNFDSSLELREILIGPMSSVTRADVAEALDGLEGVEAWKTRLAFQGYKIVRQHDPSMWP